MYLSEEQLEGLPHKHLAQTCFIISISNGGINRHRPVSLWLEEWGQFVSSSERDFDLDAINTWLSSRTLEQKEVIADADHVEQILSLAGSPEGTDELLNLFFEEVC